MKFNYAETRAVIRVRSLDIKGPVNEAYELLRGGDGIGLAGKASNPQRGSHGMMWLGPCKGPWRG